MAVNQGYSNSVCSTEEKKKTICKLACCGTVKVSQLIKYTLLRVRNEIFLFSVFWKDTSKTREPAS